MEDINSKFQGAQMSFMGKSGGKKAGTLVETKTGLIGRTYNNEELIGGKVRVYTDKGNLLCTPETLKLKGFIN